MKTQFGEVLQFDSSWFDIHISSAATQRAWCVSIT